MNGQEHPGFKTAVAYFGSQVEMARRLGVTPQAISLYRRKGLSPAAAIRAERVTKGVLRAVELVGHDEAATQ